LLNPLASALSTSIPQVVLTTTEHAQLALIILTNFPQSALLPLLELIANPAVFATPTFGEMETPQLSPWIMHAKLVLLMVPSLSKHHRLPLQLLLAHVLKARTELVMIVQHAPMVALPILLAKLHARAPSVNTGLLPPVLLLPLVQVALLPLAQPLDLAAKMLAFVMLAISEMPRLLETQQETVNYALLPVPVLFKQQVLHPKPPMLLVCALPTRLLHLEQMIMPLLVALLALLVLAQPWDPLSLLHVIARPTFMGMPQLLLVLALLVLLGVQALLKRQLLPLSLLLVCAQREATPPITSITMLEDARFARLERRLPIIPVAVIQIMQVIWLKVIAVPPSYITADGADGGYAQVPTTLVVCVCPVGLYNTECNSETHNCYGCIGAVPTMAPTAPTAAPSSATDASSKASFGASSTGAVVGSVCGVLVLSGIGYYFYSQKQALAKLAAENATTGLDSNNKI
jgi:hypothetical protein